MHYRLICGWCPLCFPCKQRSVRRSVSV